MQKGRMWTEASPALHTKNRGLIGLPPWRVASTSARKSPEHPHTRTTTHTHKGEVADCWACRRERNRNGQSVAMHYSLWGHGYSPAYFFFVQGCHAHVFGHQSGATVSAFQSVETLRYTTAVHLCATVQAYYRGAHCTGGYIITT